MEQSIEVPWSRLNTERLTAFQRDVLEHTDDVPPGQTISYGQLARTMDREGLGQAVGQALKANPFPVLVPCHRVIRADGSLGGYGGQPDSNVKRRLLEWESSQEP